MYSRLCNLSGICSTIAVVPCLLHVASIVLLVFVTVAPPYCSTHVRDNHFVIKSRNCCIVAKIFERIDNGLRLEKLSLEELKQELVKYDLPCYGNRAQCIEALVMHFSKQAQVNLRSSNETPSVLRDARMRLEDSPLLNPSYESDIAHKLYRLTQHMVQLQEVLTQSAVASTP